MTDFLDEERAGRRLEALAALGLQLEPAQEAMDAGLGDAGFGGQPAHPPKGGAVLGPLVQRDVEQLGDAFVVDRALPRVLGLE
jgi:hypothetical protein